MALTINYGKNSSLIDVQGLLRQDEEEFGPVDGIDLGIDNGNNVSTMTFDTFITDTQHFSTLLLSTDLPPNGKISYVRGNCFVDGASCGVTAYVDRDSTFLATRALSFFQSSGWNRIQAIGMIANIRAESNFDPAVPPGDQNSAFGLCQWRGDRVKNFETQMKTSLAGSTFREQLQFILWELTNNYPRVFAALQTAADLTQATTLICTDYEKPSDAAAKAVQRSQYAEDFAKNLKILV